MARSDEYPVLDPPQCVEYVLGAEIGIQKTQRRLSSQRSITRVKPVNRGFRILKDLIRAGYDPRQAQQLGCLFAIHNTSTFPVSAYTF